MVSGRRIKLRYAHLGGHNPPVIVIHGNQTQALPKSYQRYLENKFRQIFKLEGTPLKIEFKKNDNPYADRKKPIVKGIPSKQKKEQKFTSKSANKTSNKPTGRVAKKRR